MYRRSYTLWSPVIPQVEHLRSLERAHKLVCMSDRSGSLNGHPRTNLFRNGDAHTARIRSEPSRRRSSWYKPHLFACPVCGVIRVYFRHPNRGDGSSSGNARARAAGKLFVTSIFKWNWVKLIFLCTTAVVLQANIRGRATQSNGHLRTISFEKATPMQHALGRSPRRGSVPLSIPPLLPPTRPVSLAPCRKPPHPCFLVTYLVPVIGTLTSKTIYSDGSHESTLDFP